MHCTNLLLTLTLTELVETIFRTCFVLACRVARLQLDRDIPVQTSS